MEKMMKVLLVAAVILVVAAPAQALIMNADIANNAGITYKKLKLGHKIDSGDIKDGSIKGRDISDNAIDSDKIDDGSITAADMAAGTLTATVLADGAVTSAKILDATILTGDIATDTILAANIATNAIGALELSSAAIQAGDIEVADLPADGYAATYVNVGEASSVTSAMITDYTIDTVDIATNAITNVLMADNAIGSAEITNGTILGEDLGSGIAISTTDNIATTGTGTITSAGLLTASNGLTLTAGTLTLPVLSVANTALQATVSLLGQSIEGTEIADGTIGGPDLAPAIAISTIGSVTVDNAIWDADAITTTGASSGFAINTANAGLADGNIAINAGTGVITFTAGSFVGLPVGGTSVALAPVVDADSTINPGASNAVALTVRGSSNGANPNIMLVKNSGGTAVITTDYTGATTFSQAVALNGGLAMDTDKFTVADTTGNVYTAGTLNSLGDFAVNTNKFMVTAASGNTLVAGTLGVTGALYANGGLDRSAAATLALGGTNANAVTIGNGTNESLTVTTNGTGTAEVVLPAGSIDGTEILDATIAGGDLAANIAISTTGSLATTGAGTLSVAGTSDLIGATTVTGALYANGGLDRSAAATLALGGTNANAVTIGNGTNESLTVTTNGTGTAEVVLPAGSIDGTEILDATIAGGDLAANIAISTTGSLATTGAGTLSVAGTSDLIGATTVTGALYANGGLDRSAAATLALGGTNANAVDVSKSGVATTVKGTLNVDEAVTLDSTLGVTGAATVQGALTTGNIIAYGVGADQAITLDAKGAAGITLGSGDVTALTVTTDSTGTAEVVLPAGSIDGTEILDATISSSDLATNIAITTTGLANLDGGIAIDTTNFTVNGTTGAVHSAGDFDIATNKFTVAAATGNTLVAGTLGVTGNVNVNTNKFNITAASGDTAVAGTIGVAGLSNLDGGIAVDTTNFTVSGTTGDVATAGDVAVNGGDITSTAATMTLNPAGSGAVNPGADSTDTLGTTGTRWSTIFADTLNYSDALTDANLTNTTVTMGNDKALDTLNITANTTLTSDHWAVTEPGVATFTGVNGPLGSATPAAIDATTIQLDDTLTFDTSNESIVNSANTFTFKRDDSGTVTINAADDNAVADLIVAPGSTGAMTLGSGTATSITLSTDGSGTTEVVLPAGSIDSTEILNETIVSADILNGTIAGGDLATDIAISTTGSVATTGAGTITSAGTLTASNGLTATTGTVDFSGATKFKLKVVAGLTDGGTCAAAGDVGSIAMGDTDASGDAVLLICEKTAAAAYAWKVNN